MNVYIGPQLILQLNIEGISQAKCDYLTRLVNDFNVYLILLQETHTKDEDDLYRRGFIHGFELISAIHDKRYGTAIYIKSLQAEYEILFEEVVNDIFLSAVLVAG